MHEKNRKMGELVPTQQVEQEKSYGIFRNLQGDLLIKIKARIADAKKPVIVYDGKLHAVLYRNTENIIVLDYINERARPFLEKAKRVIVVEAHDEAIVREYVAPVQQVKQVPLPINIA